MIDFSNPFAHWPLLLRGFIPSLGDSTIPEPIYNALKIVWPRRDEKPLAVVDGSLLRVWGTCLGSVQVICLATFNSPAEFSYIPYLEFAAI